MLYSSVDDTEAKATPMARHDDDKSKVKVKQISVRNDSLYEEDEEPMSPSGALLRHFNMDCYILVIIGVDKPVDVPSMKTTLQSTLIKQKRFSSVVKRYKKGHQQWLRNFFDIDNHVIVPELSVSYTQGFDFVEKYTASLATSPPLDPSLPLWQIHVLNYKSAEAEASVILKIHHCIGDCISLMSLFLDCTRKNCQPESLPTIPLINRYSRSNLPIWNVTAILQALWGVMFVVWCTVLDLFQFMATFLWMKDSKMLRGPPGVIHHPKTLAHVTVDLEDIAIVRKAIDGTVNDVVTGMLSAGFARYFDRLYAKDRSSFQKASSLRIRALVPVNMRPSPGLHKLEYMIENPQEARWGNEFAFWMLPFRLQNEEQEDDFLEYCRVARAELKKNKASYQPRFNLFLKTLFARVFGVDTIMKALYRVCQNTTLVFSNVMGPVETVQFLGNPVTHIVTTVSGMPQGLIVHFQSYAGKAKLIAMAAEDMFPNPHQLCMDCAHALTRMKEEALSLSANKLSNQYRFRPSSNVLGVYKDKKR